MQKRATEHLMASLPGRVAIGTAASIMTSLVIAVVLAMLIGHGKMSPEMMNYGVMILLMLSSVVGAMIARIHCSSRIMIVCIVTALCYWISLLSITALLFEGMYSGVSATALVIIAGGIIAGCLPTWQGKSTKKRIRKKRYS